MPRPSSPKDSRAKNRRVWLNKGKPCSKSTVFFWPPNQPARQGFPQNTFSGELQGFLRLAARFALQAPFTPSPLRWRQCGSSALAGRRAWRARQVLLPRFALVGFPWLSGFHGQTREDTTEQTAFPHVPVSITACQCLVSFLWWPETQNPNSRSLYKCAACKRTGGHSGSSEAVMNFINLCNNAGRTTSEWFRVLLNGHSASKKQAEPARRRRYSRAW